ncbi:sigma-70 family RNA polymerase sigma factor [uncultured Kriegella sp.]|uniref:RNA polymerase sigma factor n=1 Tax=uncultured Kriegella sp. TaxID=1798910 RepID=UPI0030D89EAF|tara:strand:+ start:38921 stop:40171 length:1251 start_codon:yes stop_codon:yes gene_type:complete
MEETKNEQLVEHVFRHGYGKIVSFLVHKFGPTHLERIEDAVQEALLKAMQVWGYETPPKNPTSWLLRVANNHLIDTLRRDKKVVQSYDASIFNTERSAQEEVCLNESINDSQLKMIFACCHPSLSQEYQIVLSLKLIGGFGNREIAMALFKKEETIAKSFTRAKKRLKAHVKTLDIPLELALRSRLAIVLKIIYLLFSEGYSTSFGETLIKKDICLEAIRLALLLSQNKYSNQPEVHALLALMCLHTARFEARVDQKGNMVDLEHQDRSLYNQDLIKIGIHHLEKAAVDSEPSNYHLQAAISYYHCTAGNFEKTDWKSILRLYKLQLSKQYSPIVQLNSIVPYYKIHGAQKALGVLHDFEKSDYFLKNALFYGIKSTLLLDLNLTKESKLALQMAISLTTNTKEKLYLSEKLKTMG